MGTSSLEHVNITVSDPLATAKKLCELFDWHIRWQGPAALGGTTVHVGSDDSYLAVYSGPPATDPTVVSHAMRGGLNHVGIVVDDLEQVEARVVAAGYRPHSHADYEPGRRFYFDDGDGVEFEVVSYT